jgi:S1-C subfamily serine protease
VHGLADPASPVRRSGTLVRDDGWLLTVDTAVPGAPGESGGPLVDDDGAALGILSGMEAGGDRRLEYTDLARAVGYARTHGAPADLELVPGTAPFSPG